VSFRQAEWQSVMHRWMDRWLDDIPNGVMTEPMADIQRPDGTWETHSSWPDVNAEKVELHFGPATEEAADTLRLGAAPGDPRQSFVDQVETQAVKIGNAEQTRPGRLAYVTQPLDQTVRLSGTPELRVRMDTTSTSALLSALLVDYGEGETVSVQGVDPLQLIQEPCEPENLAANAGCATPPEVSSTITPQRVLAWGTSTRRTSPACARVRTWCQVRSTSCAGTRCPRSTSSRPAIGSAWSSPVTTTPARPCTAHGETPPRSAAR
jgi:X-Pro dipeptidyl-peptidase